MLYQKARSDFRFRSEVWAEKASVDKVFTADAITCLRKPGTCSVKMIKLSHYEKVYYLPVKCLYFFHDRKVNAGKGFIEK